MPHFLATLVAVAGLLGCAAVHGADTAATDTGRSTLNPAAPMQPFVLPYDDARPGPTDISFLNRGPAGKDGPVRVGPDGRLYTGARRIRFLGVNTCFRGNFPDHATAEKVAGRMARFGINAVRFHHMDMQRFPSGIMRRDGRNSRELDPEALDRLDYFIAQLKARGIYSDLNLLVSRTFTAADGLPPEIEQVGDWKDRHIIGFFYPQHLELQKEYARNLLTHKNPYTNTTYANEPAVAFVEINNEQGLLQAWLGGKLDRLPKVFADELQRQWNAWLKSRHGHTNQMKVNWAARSEPLGQEMVRFSDLKAWTLERHNGAEARLSLNQAMRLSPLQVEVTKTTGTGWHVQLNQAGIKVQKGGLYTLSFQASAKEKARITVGLRQTREPWGNLGLAAAADLAPDWKTFTFTFLADRDDDNARIDFSDLGAKGNTVYFASVSLKPGGSIGLGEGESLEAGTVAPLQRGAVKGATEPAQRDWVAFLWETEDKYWQTMYRYLKDDLKVQALVFGTIVACSTPNLQARMDIVDTHAYWQHPHFPRRPWDPADWTVNNVSMVNSPGGAVAGLARQRVKGKPLFCTEYNHSAPNTYSSETALLLGAFAALQDWDGVFLFAYNHSGSWDLRRINSFFDIDQHPTKMANLLIAAALFGRGDLSPAREERMVLLDRADEIEWIRTRGRAWGLVDGGSAGLPADLGLLHRIGINPDTRSRRDPKAMGPDNPVLDLPPQVKQGRRYVSDTGQLVWDLSRSGKGVVTVNSPRTRLVCGFTAGRSFRLGDVAITPGPTRQDWCTVALTLLEGDSFTGKGRLLIVATGDAANTDMKWLDEKKNSVGANWGKAPSLVEVVPATIELPVPASRIAAFALDENGQRGPALKVEDKNGKAVLQLGEAATLWYEVLLR